MSAELGTSCDQCRSMVQYSFTSTETRRFVRTDSPGRPPRLSHSSWTMWEGLMMMKWCLMSSDVSWNIRDKLWPMPKAARFNKSLRTRKPEGSLGRTAQDGHLNSHTAPELWVRGPVAKQVLIRRVQYIPWAVQYIPWATGKGQTAASMDLYVTWHSA